MGRNIITGQVVGNSGEGFFSTCLIQSYQESVRGLKHDYTRKSSVNLNSLFYPYSCDPSGTINTSGVYETEYYNMPHFLTPTSGAEEPTVLDLHPFNSGHDVGFATHDSGVDHANNLNPIQQHPDRHNYRGIALKGPLVITGPCYDIDGNPYPAPPSGEESSVINSGFAKDYMNRSDLWATGPVDLRFDPERGVYVAGTGGGSKIVKIIDKGEGNFPIPSGNETVQGGNFKRAYIVQEYKIEYTNEQGEVVDPYEGAKVKLSPVGEEFFAGNFRSNIILANRFYTCNKINGGYAIDNQADFVEFT